MKKKAVDGFTLIELLIVIAILAILAAIAIPNFGNTIRRAHEAKTLGNLGALRAMIGIYYTNMEGRYPIDDLQSLNETIPEAYTPTYHPRSSVVGTSFSVSANPTEGGWLYFNDPNENSYGSVIVNCSHQDLRNRTWSTY